MHSSTARSAGVPSSPARIEKKYCGIRPPQVQNLCGFWHPPARKASEKLRCPQHRWCDLSEHSRENYLGLEMCRELAAGAVISSALGPIDKCVECRKSPTSMGHLVRREAGRHRPRSSSGRQRLRLFVARPEWMSEDSLARLETDRQVAQWNLGSRLAGWSNARLDWKNAGCASLSRKLISAQMLGSSVLEAPKRPSIEGANHANS